MRLILYKWGGLSEDILKRNLEESGHEVITIFRKCKNYTRDMDLAGEMLTLINDKDVDAVISYNYIPIVSMVCKTTNILYFSWIYDSPHYTLFAGTVSYDCNRIGCFDGDMVSEMNNKGIMTIHHLPLGFDEKAFDFTKGPIDVMHDVSFVGNLYTDIYDYYSRIRIPDDIRKKADALISEASFSYERNIVDGFFEDEEGNHDEQLSERAKEVLKNAGLILGDDYYYEDDEYVFRASLLEKKVTIEERRKLLLTLVERGYNLSLYTDSDLSGIPELKRAYRGYADYFEKMPQVFRSSKINLNISLRSIRSGIPLRALDIMGCGGFLLSNYQSELAGSFAEGKEMVLFYDMEDCLDKIGYYLTHDKERIEIAEAGREAVKTRFDFKTQLKKLLNY